VIVDVKKFKIFKKLSLIFMKIDMKQIVHHMVVLVKLLFYFLLMEVKKLNISVKIV
jgi:hypothetical protein